jgi:hypothetical protein
MKLTISHRGQTHALEVAASATMNELQERIDEVTGVPPQFQKLIYGKGKKHAGEQSQETLGAAGLKDGAKIMVMGSSQAAVSSLQKEESETQRRNAIMAQRSARGPTKVWSRSTETAASAAAKATYKFHRVAPLSHLPNPAEAEALLMRLAEDPAILHVMQKHEFAVGLLTELAPHEHPHLLGLNTNKGQSIKLRLRTDRYDGMRLYADVRRVLCHELTHNVWGDHDNNFKELNSILNREVAEFERSRTAGTHHLGGGAGDSYYEPALEADAYAGGAYVLGGKSISSPAGGSGQDESRDARRLRALEAATRRLQEREAEIEQMCGSTGTIHGEDEAKNAPES